MAIIDIDKKRDSSGGYLKLLGDEDMANLIRSCHAAIIKKVLYYETIM